MNNQISFSGLKRNENINNAQQIIYDLIVVGGGVTGAGIALDAVSRGLKVLLLEKQDFASGTSSRSTKLIHGGLRYLKQFEFALVREVGREREIVYQNAKHIVRPEKMFLPIIKNGSLGELGASVGIYVYDWLAGVKPAERRKMLNKKQALDSEPILNEELLKSAALYTEYRTDDARLVIEILKRAVELGAHCFNYLNVDSFIYSSEGKVEGVKALDSINNKQYEFKSKEFVNAAGPWVDRLREEDKSMNNKRLFHSKGVHIVVKKEKLPINQATYFDVVGDKGRMIFAIPRGKVTYIGTTDTAYKGELEEPGITQKDVDYILNATNQIFPTANLKKEDVISSWSGLRPLIYEEGKSPSEMSRKDEVFVSDTGLISIAGGKLTGYRKMAEKVVDMVMNRFQEAGDKGFVECKTNQIILSGGDFDGTVEEFLTGLKNKFPDFNSDHIEDLFFKYGSNTEQILQNMADKSEEALLISEFSYCVENEMVIKPTDFFVRRTGDLFFSPWRIEQFRSVIQSEMKRMFGLSDSEIVELNKELNQQCAIVLNFK